MTNLKQPGPNQPVHSMTSDSTETPKAGCTCTVLCNMNGPCTIERCDWCKNLEAENARVTQELAALKTKYPTGDTCPTTINQFGEYIKRRDCQGSALEARLKAAVEALEALSFPFNWDTFRGSLDRHEYWKRDGTDPR